MSSKRKSDDYTEEELKAIKEQWLKDKMRIDADPTYEYIYDRDREYIRFLNNENLSILFRHAARLYRDIQHEKELILHPGEEQKIIEVFKKIEKDGYYDQSKKEEREVRAHFGKICSRQTYRKYFYKG
ncbi:MAG: hypothetical protein AAB309_00330 [Deltaproteobacteria bacterium]